MLHERDSERHEIPKTQYAEDVFESLPKVKPGIEIPRIALTRLTSGKDGELKLSAQESAEREGWDPEAVVHARKGNTLLNRSGQLYEVTATDRDHLRIKGIEDGDEGAIFYKPRPTKSKEYTYQLRDRDGNSRKIKVHDAVYRDDSFDTSELLDSIMSSVPAQCLDVFDEVRILKRETSSKGGKFRAEPSLISDTRSITLYVDPDIADPEEEIIQILYHELGHAIAKHLKGSTNPGARWKKAMDADGNSVSEYSAKTRYPKREDHGEIEDFAETVKLYLSTDGAKTDATQRLRKFCENRFAKLDEVFDDLAARQKSSALGRLRKRVFGGETPLHASP